MKLIFKGVVQGVGFRPMIYRIATSLGLKGYVINKGSEVEVVIDRNVDMFVARVKQELPPTATLHDIVISPDERSFHDFRILQSKQGEKKSLIPPDIDICDDCLQELFDPHNRRYHYPFTNCTVCGARFSLIEDVPYDRVRTSMAPFSLCSDCTRDYTEVNNRRYHAQTISCPVCGPRYRLYDKKGKDLGEIRAIERFAEQIEQGNIGVIKSWGGMHLCCILQELPRFRSWYRRPQKPFAIMVRDISTAQRYGEISKDEKELLQSHKRPIVLMKKKTAELVSPGLDTIGIFLPYSGLHHLLFSLLNADALVMTSANIPGEPMIIKNDQVFALNADCYLLHNRDIFNRIDDSVVRLWKGNRFFLRKSRGFVPDVLYVSYKHTIISVGAGENICGALSVDEQLFCTQYIGNAKYYGTIEFLEESLRHFMKLFLKRDILDAVTMDLHPGYESRTVAQKFAKEYSIPAIDVQHHWAHAASLLLDRGLDHSVVLTLDGLGFGTDKTFWGGEILDASFEKYNRIGHLEYLPLIGSDQATRDPRRLVFAIFKQYNKNKFFKGHEADILSKLMKTSPLSSSLGRYLDALSCYLNICTNRTYNGEPAMKLEQYLAQGKPRYSFDIEIKNNVVGVHDLFRQMEDIIHFPLSEKTKADFAYSAVHTIMDALCDIAVHHANDTGMKTIGLTGGVSYNIPITKMVEQYVEKAGLQLIVHHTVPNGDGGIAVGQNAIAGYQLSH